MSHLIVRCKTPTIVARMLAITVGVFYYLPIVIVSDYDYGLSNSRLIMSAV